MLNKTCHCCLLTKLCLTLCNPMDCSLPGSSVHGFPRQEHWNELSFPSPGDLLNPGIEPGPSSVKVLTFCNFFFIQKKKKKERKKVPAIWLPGSFGNGLSFFFFLPILLFLCQLVLTWWGSHFQEFCMKKRSLTLDAKKHLNVQNPVTFSPFFLWLSL